MATLTFITSAGVEQQVELRAEIYVGRSAGNDVVLDEQGVSRQHCRFFVSEDGQAWVEDLGSSNGVLVDGVHIGEATPIAEGMDIVIGGVHCSLVERRRTARRPTTTRSAPSSALAKRASASAPARATRMMAAAEMPAKRSRPAPRRVAQAGGAQGSSARPQLTGLDGPWAGMVFDINRSRMVVGRTAPADVLLEDDSISRRHAEIYKTGSIVSVRDLGSANGTFVNGERVTEASLAPGDVLRFGVVELSYSGPGQARAGGDPKRKKLLILGGAGAAVLLLVVVVALSSSPPPAVPTDQGIPMDAPPDAEDPIKLLGKCKAYADPENSSFNWENAVEACGKAYALDPALTEAKLYERQAKREIEFEKLLAEARLKISTSQEDAALDMLVKVDDSSNAFGRAHTMFKEASERLGKRKKTACKTDYKAGLYVQAYESCKRFLEVTCNVEGEDPDIMKLFERSARQAGKPTSFTCPEAYAKFGKRIEDDSNRAETLVKEFYVAKGIPEREVHALMLQYYRDGRPKYVADKLKVLRVKKKRIYADRLDDIILLLDVIDGRYTSGQAGIVLGDAAKAEAFWNEAFEADAKLVPPKLRSSLVKDMGAQLAKVHFKIGWDLLQKGKLNEAFNAFYKGYKHDRSNQDVLLQLAGMEREARRSLREPSCESADFALAITIPESGVFKRAKEMKQELGCP
ncbi:MAG: FHA domain-containing protein [Myxococcales bacterium]|jgi:pSer/pThr/pTyr-binding forkhead associated (FHA) protein/tetratricopeptide (TPR) repeat protein